MTVEPGLLIGERYRIERTLGSGAMGVVFAARHVALDELVALKFMRAELRQDSEMTRRFAREAKAAAKIRSDHVAAVLDVGTDAHLGPYIAMELLEGQDLAEVVQRGRLPIPVACGYLLQACEGLALAHALGIVHRDIKPSNLYLTHRGDLEVVKVLDFGVSKAALSGVLFGGELSAADTSHMLGSPLYMSPEQIRALTAIDHRSDIWSLGVVLYELVSGRSPFDAESIADVCARILDGGFPALSEHGVPNGAELEAVIRRCLSKDPGERYADVGALAQAIAPFAPSRLRLHSVRTQSVLRRHRMDSLADVRESGMFSSTLAKDNQVASNHAAATALATSEKVTTMPDSSNTVDSAPAFRSSNRSLYWWLAVAGTIAGVVWVTQRSPDSDAPGPVSITEAGKRAIPPAEVVATDAPNKAPVGANPADTNPIDANEAAWGVVQTREQVNPQSSLPIAPPANGDAPSARTRTSWKRAPTPTRQLTTITPEAPAKADVVEHDLPSAPAEAPAAINETPTKPPLKNKLRLVNDRPLKLVD